MVKSLSEFLQTMPNVILAGVAADGASAVEVCTRHRPDLVLLDFAMPGVNGLDTAKILRRRSPATRVVMISHYSPFLAEAGPWPDVDRWYWAVSRAAPGPWWAFTRATPLAGPPAGGDGAGGAGR